MACQAATEQSGGSWRRALSSMPKASDKWRGGRELSAQTLVIAEAVSNRVDQPIVEHALNPMNWIHSMLRFLETFMEPLAEVEDEIWFRG